jgi:hypothetical protein
MLGPFRVGSNRIRVEDLWKNVVAVEKYEEEKKLLTGASGDLSRLSHPGGRLGELNPRLWVASSLHRAWSREVGVQNRTSLSTLIPIQVSPFTTASLAKA